MAPVWRRGATNAAYAGKVAQAVEWAEKNPRCGFIQGQPYHWEYQRVIRRLGLKEPDGEMTDETCIHCDGSYIPVPNPKLPDINFFSGWKGPDCPPSETPLEDVVKTRLAMLWERAQADYHVEQEMVDYTGRVTLGPDGNYQYPKRMGYRYILPKSSYFDPMKSYPAVGRTLAGCTCPFCITERRWVEMQENAEQVLVPEELNDVGFAENFDEDYDYEEEE